MNNIQEQDWAEESWHSHTGMDSSCEYCISDQSTKQARQDAATKSPTTPLDADEKSKKNNSFGDG